jgi:arginyl-tRNA synthetase
LSIHFVQPMITLLQSALKKAAQEIYSLTVDNIDVEVPHDKSHGDIAIPLAMKICKQVSQSPRAVAEALLPYITTLAEVEHAEIAGPGYINISFVPSVWIKALEETHAALLPKPVRKSELPVIIEYSQPNIAKPLGIHHLIGTIVGQAVSNLYEFSGYNVLRWNYLGDYGTQFGKLAVAKRLYAPDREATSFSIEELLELYVRFHTDIETNPALEEEGRRASKLLEDGDKELRAFWQDVVTITKKSLAEVYDRLHVAFDLDLGESFYEDKMAPVLQEGIEKGVFEIGNEGARIVTFAPTDMPPYVVQRSDGGTLYSTRDLAQMRYRIDTYKPQEILIFTDIAQKLHFEQLVATCNKLDWKLPPFTNVLFGRMRFADKKMSTRKGNILKLQEVLDEAVIEARNTIHEHGEAVKTDDPSALAEMMGIGALSYGILSQNRLSEIVFDWQKFLAFDGNSAPYIQYTHARARSILRKADVGGMLPLDTYSSVLTTKERELLRTLSRWDHIITQSRESYMPHLLCTYLYSVCQAFNSFYSVEPILEAKDTQRVLRLNLCMVTADVLRTGARILTLDVPDTM